MTWIIIRQSGVSTRLVLVWVGRNADPFSLLNLRNLQK